MTLELFRRGGEAHAANARNSKDQPLYVFTAACGRCGGGGVIDGYRHIEGGRCFGCGGNGKGKVVHERLYTAPELAKLNAMAAKKAAKKAAKAAEAAAERAAQVEAAKLERAAMVEADPLFQKLAGYLGDPFIADIREQMRARDLSDKQLEAVEAAMARLDERARVLRESRWVGDPGARIEIAGIVETCRCIHEAESYWDRSRYLIKIKTDCGQGLTWFTGYAMREGDRVRGTAKVKDHTEFKGVKETLITNPRWKGTDQ